MLEPAPASSRRGISAFDRLQDNSGPEGMSTEYTQTLEMHCILNNRLPHTRMFLLRPESLRERV